MNPQEIETLFNLLVNRVQPDSAREGVAIFNLAAKARDALVAANAIPVVHPAQPPEITEKP